MQFNKQITSFPNATISEYGQYEHESVDVIMAEIMARGPVKASINGTAIVNYKGGIISDKKYGRFYVHSFTKG